jgi:predicted enzyme related to lactoylglutathione lyase
MGEYEDYNMFPGNSEVPAAGICHARGGNAALPAQWMIYIIVEDIEKSIAECKRNGGRVIVATKAIAGDKYCVIQDPAGAVAALYEKN